MSKHFNKIYVKCHLHLKQGFRVLNPFFFPFWAYADQCIRWTTKAQKLTRTQNSLSILFNSRTVSRCTCDMITFTNQKWSQWNARSSSIYLILLSTLIRIVVIHPSNKHATTILDYSLIHGIGFGFVVLSFVIFPFFTHRLDSFSLINVNYPTQHQLFN